MAVRLASADTGWPGLRPEFVFDLIGELGLSGVLLAFFEGSTARQPAEIAQDPDGWADQIGVELSKRDLEPADVFLIPGGDLQTMTVNHPDLAQRKQSEALFQAFVRFAHRVGSSGVTILPGMIFGGESWETALNRTVTALRRRVEMANKYDLRLCVEPHVSSYTPFVGCVADTPERVASLIDRVPGLSLALDYGHFMMQGIPDREVEPLLAYARHFHVRGGARGLVQTRLEDNVIDFRRVLDRMAEIGFDGWIHIEYVHDARPGCSQCDNTQETRKFRDLIREHERMRGRL